MKYADEHNALPPHYIDDGDTLSYVHLSSIVGLAALNYDNLFIVMHGNVNGPDLWAAYTNDAQTASQWFSTDQVKAKNKAITDVYGCNPAQGLVDVSDVVTHYNLPTKKYLYE